MQFKIFLHGLSKQKFIELVKMLVHLLATLFPELDTEDLTVIQSDFAWWMQHFGDGFEK